MRLTINSNNWSIKLYDVNFNLEDILSKQIQICEDLYSTITQNRLRRNELFINKIHNDLMIYEVNWRIWKKKLKVHESNSYLNRKCQIGVQNKSNRYWILSTNDPARKQLLFLKFSLLTPLLVKNLHLESALKTLKKLSLDEDL